jgi:hypothetical protein
MKTIILIVLSAIAISSHAQPVYVENYGFKLESIADIDIGWMEIRKHTTAPKGKQLGNRTYSARQIGYSQQWVEGMQQSYLPKGCLGDARYFQNKIPKFSSTNSLRGNAINQHLAALPHMYGSSSTMYMFLKKDAQGKFAPLLNFAQYWFIEANQLQAISNPLSFISSSDDYFFVVPDFTSQSHEYEADDKAASNLKGFSSHVNIKRFKHFYVPPKVLYDNPIYVVIMTKDNKELPFENITIGEFFTEAEKQFPGWQKIESIPADSYATAQKNLARLKEKYKNRWNDIAEIELSNTDMNLFTFVNATEGRDDMFDNNGTNTSFPIQRVKKSALELCKTDQPQWLVIRWTMGMYNEPFNIHMHESILNNFNFDYAYNYFFDPGKVKDQPYKPLRSPSFKEAVVVTEASEASKRMTADKNVYFFEDFSGTAIGKSPATWTSNLINGEKAVVAEAPEATGNWIAIKGHAFKFSNFKNPFPPNFQLSFDVAVPKDFTWGGKRLDVVLGKDNSSASSFRFSIRPGSGGANGEIEVEGNFSNGYESRTKWYKAPDFSNDKISNKAKVVIIKKGEALQVFVNNNLIADYPNAMPANEVFNQLQFLHANSSGETEKYYLSHIKITKE